jgi:hypothetical protein
LKPEWWGSPLAQGEKYQGRKKTCVKRTIVTATTKTNDCILKTIVYKLIDYF